MSQQPKKLKRIVIKEELVILTGDFINAAILQQFIYWSERVKDFDTFILEERLRADRNANLTDIKPTGGWIYKKAEELSAETMLNLAPSSIRERLKKLEKQGYLLTRTNPEHKFDKVIQYRVDLCKMQRDLLKLGYALEGYKINLDIILSIKDINRETENRKEETKIRNLETEIRKTETENRVLETENRTTETKIRSTENEIRNTEKEHRSPETDIRTTDTEPRTLASRKAIPEITTKITSENKKHDVVDDVMDNPPGSQEIPEHVKIIIDDFREASGGFEIDPSQVLRYLDRWTAKYIHEKIEVVRRSKIDDSVMGFFIKSLEDNYPVPKAKAGFKLKRSRDKDVNKEPSAEKNKRQELVKKLYLT